MWDTSTGTEVVVLQGYGHQLYVTSLAFSPDGTRLASGSPGKTLLLRDSMPNRVRFQERQAILAARSEAERIVDQLWQQSIDTRSIVEQLRKDSSLSEPQRRAALNHLLTESAQLQERVDGVFAQLVFTDDVVVALETDDSLAPGPRLKAVQIARAKGDAPLRLNRDSWSLVRSADGDPEAYQVGLRGAEAAVTAEPKNLTFLTTLGVAQYRAERYQNARATLTRCDDLRRQQGRKSVVPDLAALSMAALKLGRTQEASAVFERLDRLMDDEEGYYDEAAMRWLEESRQLFERADVRIEPTENRESTPQPGEIPR
jgi:hypothetical protein